MPILTEDRRNTAHYLISEAAGYRSREQIFIASGSGVLIAGAVLGQIFDAGDASAESAAKSGGNTGQGTLTLDGSDPVLAGAKNGVYTVRCVATASGGGTFRVTDPEGFVLGDVAVGATFANDIKFVIADGDPDFALGDGFDVTVQTGQNAGKYAPYDPTATDGSQTARAILYEGCDATSADVRRTVTARDTEVHAAVLVWGEDLTDGDKSAALASLAEQGIIAR